MITDDVAALFAPLPGGAAMSATFRVAQLVAFDADDGTNTVLIGTTAVDNLPLAVSGAEIGLAAGDNVLIMYLGTTAMIWCKIATPGSANYGASNSGRSGLVLNTSAPFGLSATAVTTILSDSSIRVPAWAQSASLIMLGQAVVNNSSTQIDNWAVRARAAMPGLVDAFSAMRFGFLPQGDQGVTSALFADVIEVAPGQQMTISLEIASATVTWPSNAANAATLFAAVQFFRESA